MKRNRYRQPSRRFDAGRLIRVVVICALLAVGYLYLRDVSAPQLAVTPDQGPVSAATTLQLQLRDGGCGLKSLRVSATQGGRSKDLLVKELQGAAEASFALGLERSAVTDGALEVTIEVRDGAFFPFGRGNAVRRTLAFTVDGKPPTVELVGGTIPVWQGGAATIVYRVDEEVARSGVEADGRFFPGYRQANGLWFCVVPFPVDATPSGYKPKLVAVDRAGNETRIAPGLQLLARKFPLAKIPVSDTFLENKRDEFHRTVPDADGIELFLRMNRDVRKENRDKLVALAQETSAVPLWSEPMLRMPRAKTTGDYAEARDYFYNNRLIDHQTHLGTDLASVAQAPILAANPGKVVFAGDLGIYGGCVVIDHGLGVQTLYGHLSSVGVEVGAVVTRGQEIARSGKSGMAAGDHLHFEVLVGGVPVRPEEWMERGWIETYILGPMKAK